ncbi:MAG: hypothetical protein K2X35_12745 [Bryobacteraceae bacterium]|nr:hypothetical protein [Bryobacteraceae bacterium]
MLPSTHELCSWKEIASYLGVSVKTAQVWEATRGLPVRRLPGPRGQVRALIPDLEEWKAASATAPPPEPPPPPPPTKTISTWRRPALLLLAILSVLGIGLAVQRSLRPLPLSSARVLDNALVGFDRDGAILWRREFGSLNQAVYADGERRIWVGDLEGDGAPDVLFVPTFATTQEGVPLLRLDASGKELWRFTPGRTVSVKNEAFAPSYVVRQFAILGRYIVVTSHHYLYYPSQVAVLDPNGKLLREYWHPGHLNAVATGTYRGRPVVFLGGVNNLARQASLVVLDPERLAGAPPDTFQGIPPEQMIARVLFPRSTLAPGSPYNYVYRIHQGPADLIVDVHEFIDAKTETAIIYHLDAGYNLKSVVASDQFRMLYAATGRTFRGTKEEGLHQLTRIPAPRQ